MGACECVDRNPDPALRQQSMADIQKPFSPKFSRVKLLSPQAKVVENGKINEENKPADEPEPERKQQARKSVQFNFEQAEQITKTGQTKSILKPVTAQNSSFADTDEEVFPYDEEVEQSRYSLPISVRFTAERVI